MARECVTQRAFPCQGSEAFDKLIEVVGDRAIAGDDFGLTDFAAFRVQRERDDSRAARASGNGFSPLLGGGLGRGVKLGGRHELFALRLERLDGVHGFNRHHRASSLLANSPARMASMATSARESALLNEPSDTESWGKSEQVT